jgi:hypothetical protein
MARVTSKGLYIWDLSSDTFNHNQLAANWDTIDSYLTGFDTTTKLPKRINTSATVPVGGTAGDVVMLSAATGGFSQWTILKYDGSVWKTVGIEVASAVPTQGLYPGRVIVLSSASGTFNPYDMIRYDGTSWALVGGLQQTTTGGGAQNVDGMSTSGDILFTSATRGVVFKDRATGLYWRLFIRNANLEVEQVT